MRWASILSIVFVAAIIASTATSSAGVLGRRYVGFDLGRVNSDLGGDGTTYGAEVRMPTTDIVDLVGSFVRTDFENTSGTVAGLGFDLHGGETQWIGSYISLAGVASFPEEGDREFGFQYAGGTELKVNDAISLEVGGACAKLDKEGEAVVTLGVYWWLADRVLGSVGFARGIDPDDTTVGLGLAIGF